MPPTITRRRRRPDRRAMGARAQTAAWPTKPVTVVAPFPHGGGTDAFARPLFAAMSGDGPSAPRATPAETSARMAAEMREPLGYDEKKSAWRGLGADTRGPRGTQFGRFVGAERRRCADVAQRPGATLD